MCCSFKAGFKSPEPGDAQGKGLRIVGFGSGGVAWSLGVCVRFFVPTAHLEFMVSGLGFRVPRLDTNK